MQLKLFLSRSVITRHRQLLYLKFCIAAGMLLKRHAHAAVYINALANVVYCSNFQHSQKRKWSRPPPKKSQMPFKTTTITCLPDCKRYIDMSILIQHVMLTAKMLFPQNNRRDNTESWTGTSQNISERANKLHYVENKEPLSQTNISLFLFHSSSNRATWMLVKGKGNNKLSICSLYKDGEIVSTQKRSPLPPPLPFYNSPPYPVWILQWWSHPFHHCSNAFFSSPKAKESNRSLSPFLSVTHSPALQASSLMAHSWNHSYQVATEKIKPGLTVSLITQRNCSPWCEKTHCHSLHSEVACRLTRGSLARYHLPPKYAATIHSKTHCFSSLIKSRLPLSLSQLITLLSSLLCRVCACCLLHI